MTSVATSSPPHASASTDHAFDLGLLLLRATCGLTLAAHGAQKLFGWFGGNGISGTGEFFAAAGYRPGELMAVVAGLSEFLGGLGLALGLLTPLAGAAAIGVMVNAAAFHWSDGFFGGMEYPLVLALAAAAIAVTGPGRYALDRLLPLLHRHRLYYGLAAVVLGAGTSTAVLLLRA
ncbi:DoxX family protein [Nocardiopsis sp. YSL2]|uniref:DoxX family protein n=1 Tax=Nocardiopsis sp. YSL2 TaxID=2939492 RepID=UPI0026F45955|nr:DoxX family protein [Nocardiopsis sp. YSL2]